jgi:transposase InsO family protein
VLRIYPRSDQKTAIQFFDYVASRLPFAIERVQTDNGAEFKTAFHWHLLDHGIGHTYIRPATPRLNGKVERSHRIDAEEFYRLLDGNTPYEKLLQTTRGQIVTDRRQQHRVDLAGALSRLALAIGMDGRYERGAASQGRGAPRSIRCR